MCGKVFKTHDELSEHHSIAHSQQTNGSVSGDSAAHQDVSSTCENEEDGAVANGTAQSNGRLTANVERDRRKVSASCDPAYFYDCL